MKAAGAMAGMASAVMLLAPGCGTGDPETSDSAGAPLRRASFRAVVARDFLMSCAAGARRAETAAAAARYDELKQLGYRKEAGHALWLGENDWAAIRRHDERPPCGAGEAPYRAALAAFDARLDALAGRIADFDGGTQ